MYLLIDNYDSFTYNVYQYLSELTDDEIRVVRNDEVTIEEIEEMNPKGIVISPGPGTPEDAGISVDVIKYFGERIPILGICLGHQAIGYAYGGKIKRAKRIVHGKVEPINVDGRGVLRNLSKETLFTRYHSLVVDGESLPEELEVSAVSKDGEIMGLRHKKWPVEGVQFHPESVASKDGKRILKNFLNYRRESIDVKLLLEKLAKRENLSFDEAHGFMEELTEGELKNSQIAGFLAALNVKGVTAEEIAGFASVLREKKKRVSVDFSVIDTCGTGGDGLGTFNISSLASIVVSACGARVAKHGNRGVSSPTGSADFFRALGVPVELSPEEAKRFLETVGFAFLFAPIYHGAMKHAAPVRREMGVKTAMNLIGPLSNPADAEYQLIGVYSDKLVKTLAEAAKLLGVRRVMVVHGMEGLDEISVCGPTQIVVIDERGEVTEEIFDPKSLNLVNYTVEDLKGGDAKENAVIAIDIINNRDRANRAIRDAVLLNAGAALFVYGKVENIGRGYYMAKEALESGRVKRKFEEIIRVGKEVKGL